MMNSPHKVGEEALTDRISCREKTGRPGGEMVVVTVVVEFYCFLINIIVGSGETRRTFLCP